MTDRTKIYHHIRNRFAGDGSPTWTQGPGKFTRPCQTAAEADDLRQKHVRHLRKASGDEASEYRQAHMRGIADQLDACGPTKRRWCRHPACPRCIRTLQRWFVWTAPVAARRAARTESNRQDLSFISLVPPLRLAPGSSPAHIKKTVAALLAKLNSAMTESGITFLLGGFDVSVNIDFDGNERLQPQLWACGLREELRRAERALRDAFPASGTTPRPIWFRPYDGNVAAFAYAMKNQFIQRISIAPSAQDEGDDDGYNVEGANGGATVGRPGGPVTAKPRNTRNKALSVAQSADVALFLDALGSDRRLFLAGFAIERNKNGEAVIRPTAEAMAKVEHRAKDQGHDDDASVDYGGDGHVDNAPHDPGYDTGGEYWNDYDQGWFGGEEHDHAKGEHEPVDDDGWNEASRDDDTDDEHEADDESQTSPVKHAEQCRNRVHFNGKAMTNECRVAIPDACIDVDESSFPKRAKLRRILRKILHGR